MSWLRLIVLPALFGIGTLILNPSLADAQKGGGGKSGGGGGARPSGGVPAVGARPPGGGVAPGARPGYPNSYPYRGYGYGFGYGSIYGFGYPYSSFYLGGGYGSFGGPFGYDRFGPPYYSYYPQVYSGIELYQPPIIIPSVPANNTARIEVRLPMADAQVTLNNAKTVTTGSQRFFDTPVLEPGYSYSYLVVATWTQDGQVVRVERTIEVAPGRTTLVDFMTTNTQPRMREVDD